MSTAIYRFYGTSKWAKIQEPDAKYNNYQIDLYMDDASWRLFKKTGLQLKTRESEDGEYVTFRRPVQKIIKGKLVELGKPAVVNPLGQALDILVGNGSEVCVEVSVYDTIKGKAHTMEKVEVIGLVEYNRAIDAHAEDNSTTATGTAPTSGAGAAPRGMQGAAAAKFRPELDDEIPF